MYASIRFLLPKPETATSDRGLTTYHSTLALEILTREFGLIHNRFNPPAIVSSGKPSNQSKRL
ncbi:MAG: hypothetical protein IGS48_21185 [Oscillatoriales cyanobacterium C42_A2020_001]|nr:hypothetical protein [Leptolyngbyaceae cyanobacterium C42_A2020_001]